MVLGLRSRNKRGASVQVDFIIHVKELKPWPPSQSLRSLRSVLLVWQNGDHNSGSSLFNVGDASIEFNETFTLSVTLCREKKAQDNFQKNFLNFYLYEPSRRDRTGKGQLLGTSAINLADFGGIEDSVTTSTPLNCKKGSRIFEQPKLLVTIQPVHKDSLSEKTSSIDRDDQVSVADSVNEGNDDQYEIASFTDDDVSSYSSLDVPMSSSTAAKAPPPPLHEKDGAESEHFKRDHIDPDTLPAPVPALSRASFLSNGLEAPSESKALMSWEASTSNVENLMNRHTSLPKLSERSTTSVQEESDALIVEHSLSFARYQASSGSSSIANSDAYTGTRSPFDFQESQHGSFGHDENDLGSDLNVTIQGGMSSDEKQTKRDDERIPRDDLHVGAQESQVRNNEHGENKINNLPIGLVGGNDIKQKLESEHDEKIITIDDQHISLQESREREMDHAESEVTNTIDIGLVSENDINDRLETEQKEERTPRDDLQVGVQESQERKMRTGHAASEIIENLHDDNVDGEEGISRYDLHAGLVEGKGMKKNLKLEQEEETIPIHDPHPSHGVGMDVKEKLEIEQEEKKIPRDDLNVGFQEARKNEMNMGHVESEAVNDLHVDLASGNHKFEKEETNKWISRIEMLEEELRETAAVEISLYSVVAEHSSSSSKVHAPARRLSRFFFHACKDKSQTKQTSSARTAVSGLALVSKACGNDVPRLTFWLSNTIMLRAIVSQTAVETVDKNRPCKEHINWGDMETFTLALEQVEAWIFSRIVESLWWQTFTPHMQRTVARTKGRSNGSNSNKKGITRGFGDEEPGSFSIDLWKKAFRDACERLCPFRAEGHECGCLPMLAKLVMEQLVSRLDVAMFNAILRESVDEMPTDPVSDPISNPKVLPIPVGKLSFGAGVQLKNAIGNWCRWLSDLFEGEEEEEESRRKPFGLLNALSDLMMLPLQMLADPPSRKQVCPTLGPSLVKIILSLYGPDEFSPHPVPLQVLEALDYEDDDDMGDSAEYFASFPCTAAPTVYSSPAAPSVATFVGYFPGTRPLLRSGSTVLKKAHTSDDELDEVDSPLTSIVAGPSRGRPSSTGLLNWTTPKAKGSPSLIRYQLLQELWREDEDE
ncbi:unnamed protein product [Cuscuta campestris]|uniref:C2 NT-type domain-containing protein n=1 Tax=Cuscuta campestris TaxID=132261 RepID=A0A484L580_9ASTE|nr:unnamed protein product [Cuscuta campestris]